jgi:tripartite-type tricarboxylate transporter receptor subunit TctC
VTKPMQWLALALVTAFSGTAAQAQYPNKPVRLVLPYSPGGIVD